MIDVRARYWAHRYKHLEDEAKRLRELLHQARELAEFYAEGGEGRPLPWLPCGAGVFIGKSQKLYTCTLPEGHEGSHRCGDEVGCNYRGALVGCHSTTCPVHGGEE